MTRLDGIGSTLVILNLFQDPFGHTFQLMRQERQRCVYILASRPYGTLYIGVTSDLIARLWQHRTNALPGFTARHHVLHLVHFDLFDDMEHAIAREKQLKNWRRQWKINLINASNPEWADLAVTLGLPALAPKRGHDGC